MLIDILTGQKFNVNPVIDHDDIKTEGFYIFEDSPSALTYFNYSKSIIGLKPNVNGLVLNGWIDFEASNCTDHDELLSKVNMWARKIEESKDTESLNLP